MKEIELLVTDEELKLYALYCLKHNIKFSEWMRKIANEAIKKEKND